MGCVHGKRSGGSAGFEEEHHQYEQQPEVLKGDGLAKKQSFSPKVEHQLQHQNGVDDEAEQDVLTSDSDDDSFTEGLAGLPLCIPGGRADSRANSHQGTPKLRSEAGTPKLKSESGTPKIKPKAQSKSGTPKTRSESGTPKSRVLSYILPKVKGEGGKTSKYGTPHDFTAGRKGYDHQQHQNTLLDSLDLEPDMGISRLSRISDQYLPASGTKIVKVPHGNFELRFSYLTQRGYYPEALDKANQDSFCAHTLFGESPNDHFFGVFDGHGEFGSQCSQFAKKQLCENLLRNPQFRNDAINAYHDAFLTTNTELHHLAGVDDTMSGTTAITVLVRGGMLYVANVGDSRAVIAERRGDNLVAVDLSTDQTPFREDECERVKKCGARILTLDQLEGLKDPTVQCWGGEDDDDGDPPRLWVQDGMFPGTAFTRSIGDAAAEDIGVFAVPEILVMELTSNHSFFVIASDGVFEFLNSQAVVDMAAKHDDPKDACAAIVAESYRLWLQYETRTDDITIIIVHIDSLQNVEIASETFHKDAQVKHTKPGSKSPIRALVEVPKGIRPPRHNQLRAPARAIEASLDAEEPWIPTVEPHAKSPEEEAEITQALQGSFFLQSLSEKQRRMLIECMYVVEVEAGDIVIRQDFESDLFYIVESGEFEVLVSQNGASAIEELGTVIHHYNAKSSPCFGELALMYNKPAQGTVRAVTNGALWVLEREAYRSILVMSHKPLPSLKTLRSVEILSKLSWSHLHNLSEALTEVSFRAGHIIVEKDSNLDAFYIVNEGHVDVEYHDAEDEVEEFQLPRASLEWAGEKCAFIEQGNRHGNRSPQVKSFGEWLLLNKPAKSITAVATSDLKCWVISPQNFEDAVGRLSSIIFEDTKHVEKMSHLRKIQLAEVDEYVFERISLKDLDWQETVYTTDCCEVGLALCNKSGDIVSMKRYQRRKVQRLGRENQVLLERSLFKQLRPSPFVPHLLATPIDNDSVALVLNSILSGPLELLLHSSLAEKSACFLAANIVLAIELLHKDGVVYRGISPDILMVDRKGRIQLVDFRFAKQMSDERTFTICGMADFLAPEMILGQGHGLASDWWALGVLVYYMLQGELPFGSWRESELEIFGKIVNRHMTFPSSFSFDAMDLVDKLLVVDPSERLGCDSQGLKAIKKHPWFQDINWDKLLEGSFEVPAEIASRIQFAFDFLPVDDGYQVFGLQPDEENPPWLDGW